MKKQRHTIEGDAAGIQKTEYSLIITLSVLTGVLLYALVILFEAVIH